MPKLIIAMGSLLIISGGLSPTSIYSQVLFSDNFNSGVLNQAWVASGPCSWQITNGEVRTSDYQCQTHCDLRVGNQTWTDYRLELDMTGYAGQDKVFSFREYGINFRTAPNNDIHLAGNGEDLVQHYTNYNGTSYHFKVECVGARIKVWINGGLVFDYVDNAAPSLSGGIALQLYSGGPCAADVGFDNVFVTRLGGCPSLSVLPWYQHSAPWGTERYDKAGISWSTSDTSIKRWGCAMTCMAMVARFYGVSAGPDGKPVNPSNFNKWMNSNGGFDSRGNVYFQTVLNKYSKYSNNKIKWVKNSGASLENLVLQDLNAGRPVILQVRIKLRDNKGKYYWSTHYVLATGKSDCNTINIIDPSFANRTKLSDYANSYQNIIRYAPVGYARLQSGSGGLLVSVPGNVQLLYTDSAGNRLGYDPSTDSIYDDIPTGATLQLYTEPDSSDADSSIIQDTVPMAIVNQLYLDSVSEGKVNITVFSTDTAAYTMDISYFNDVSDSPFVSLIQGNLTPGQPNSILVDIHPSCCQGTTGNANETGIVDLADLSALVSYLTGGGYVLPCVEEANVNAVGIVDLADLSALVNHLTGEGYVLPDCL